VYELPNGKDMHNVEWGWVPVKLTPIQRPGVSDLLSLVTAEPTQCYLTLCLGHCRTPDFGTVTLVGTALVFARLIRGVMMVLASLMNPRIDGGHHT
jgi:hypothetical protein